MPDTVGDGHGIGRCRIYSGRKKAGASARELRELLIDLGNSPDDPLFWGGYEGRDCRQFSPLAT